MSHVKQMLAVFAVATFGLWGCAEGPTSRTVAQAERIKILEAKNAKLEEDFRTAAAGREQFRKKLAAAEEQRTVLQQDVEQLQGVVKERDELSQQVKARVTERDAVQVQFDQFRKNIRDLLGQAEANLPKPVGQPVTSVTTDQPGNKS
jgi:hypothetical protein